MEIRYNVTGAKRKELVKIIADTTGARAEYKFMPTCNYEIDGTLLFDDRADSEEVERVLEAIAAAGFECEPQDGGEQPSGEETKEAPESADTAPQVANLRGPRQTNRFVGERTSSEVNELSASDGSERYGACEDTLTVEIPLDKVAVGNLTKLLDAKGNLIRNGKPWASPTFTLRCWTTGWRSPGSLR